MSAPRSPARALQRPDPGGVSRRDRAGARYPRHVAYLSSKGRPASPRYDARASILERLACRARPDSCGSVGSWIRRHRIGGLAGERSSALGSGAAPPCPNVDAGTCPQQGYRGLPAHSTREPTAIASPRLHDAIGVTIGGAGGNSHHHASPLCGCPRSHRTLGHAARWPLLSPPNSPKTVAPCAWRTTAGSRQRRGAASVSPTRTEPGRASRDAAANPVAVTCGRAGAPRRRSVAARAGGPRTRRRRGLLRCGRSPHELASPEP